VTRMFHPAGILGTMRPYCRRSMACLNQTDPPKVMHPGAQRPWQLIRAPRWPGRRADRLSGRRSVLGVTRGCLFAITSRPCR
jgi:hypothetical protein